MSNRNILQALQSAGGAGGAGLDVDEVFSTYLYEGNASTQTITNGLDLSGEGGLVWVKGRSGTAGSSGWGGDIGHTLFDSSEPQKPLNSALTNARTNFGAAGVNFTGTGFTVGYNGFNDLNYSGFPYVSWSFLKSKRFFDIQNWTGDGTSNRQIPHSIDGPVGFILIKRTDTTGANWLAWHRSVDPGYGILDLTGAFTSGSNGFFNAVTDTYFETSWLNTSGATYVAYLFAHNDGDGEFGPDGDADIIKCGSYTGDGGAGTTEVDLGFEPQWILVKASSAGDNWFVIDNMRGWGTHNNQSNDAYLYPNNSNAESTGGFLDITSTGFKTTLYSNVNVSGRDHIYIAIRRGPLAPPTSATDVFGISYAQNEYTVPFPVDFMLSKIMSGANGYARDRLRGGTKYLLPDTTNADLSGGDVGFDDMTGTKSSSWGTSFIHYNWKRAPNYMDCLTYSGNGLDPDTRSLNHNLAAPVEMCWIKCRSTTEKWMVWHKDLTQFVSGGKTYGNSLTLNDNTAVDGTGIINVSETNATTLKLGFRSSNNTSGQNYISYLFSTLAGISKVGSYTGNGSVQNIDCGFSNGARFVLIKKSSGTGGWVLMDSERGIVSGDESYLYLNETYGSSLADLIDPYSGGFATGANGTYLNVSGSTYIFYAIA